MSAYYMRRSTYQKDYINQDHLPQNALERSKFFPYPDRNNIRRYDELNKNYNSLERFDEKLLQRGRNETSNQYEDRLRQMRLSDDMPPMGRDHHRYERRHYFPGNNDRREALADRGPRPQHHPRGRDHHNEDDDFYHYFNDRNDRRHGESLSEQGPRPQRHHNRGYIPEEPLSERVNHQEHHSPRMNHEQNSPRMHTEAHNSPRMQQMRHNSERLNRQGGHYYQQDNRARPRGGVYLLSRVPKTSNALRDMKHYFQRNHRYVTTAGGELIGVPEQIFLKYGGALGYPDWKDEKDGEAANVMAVLWFPHAQAANSWATSGPLLKADHLLDSTTNSLALLPIYYRPRKDSFPTYLLIELRTHVRRPDDREEFRQMIVDRMTSIFTQYPDDWCSAFVVNTFVDYEAMPELQLLDKFMDRTFVFLHNFRNKYDATKFLNQFLDNAYDLNMGQYVATIFDLKYNF